MSQTVLGIDMVLDVDTGETIGYYIEGHVDKLDFANSVLEEEEEVISPDEVKHGYKFQTTLDEDDCDDFCSCRLHFHSKGREGWLPATFWGDV